MSFGERDTNTLRSTDAQTERRGDALQDAELEQALRNFRLSVHAWSEAVSGSPRTLAHEVRRRSWRLAAGVALGCFLAAGSVTGALYERHQIQEAARQEAAARAAAAQERILAAERISAADRALLTNVDSDVSQEVPSAMEPLAQLMEVGERN